MSAQPIQRGIQQHYYHPERQPQTVQSVTTNNRPSVTETENDHHAASRQVKTTSSVAAFTICLQGFTAARSTMAAGQVCVCVPHKNRSNGILPHPLLTQIRTCTRCPIEGRFKWSRNSVTLYVLVQYYQGFTYQALVKRIQISIWPCYHLHNKDRSRDIGTVLLSIATVFSLFFFMVQGLQSGKGDLFLFFYLLDIWEEEEKNNPCLFT